MKKKLLAAALITGCVAVANATNLQFDVYNPGDKSIFPVTSVLVSGKKEAILVDAQFQKNDAEQLVQKIKDSGKTLKAIYISHSDPDYYFGLDVLHEAFPQAEIISTAQTAYQINATKDGKLAYWGPILKENAPSNVIVPAAISEKQLIIDGEIIEIKQNDKDPDHAYLWAPSEKTILGGISVNSGAHVWLADTQTSEALQLWIDKLDEMKALNPQKVIPGHFLKSNYDVGEIEFTQKYLKTAQQALATSQDSGTFIAQMKKSYPNLPGEQNLELGAKVLTYEMPWLYVPSYPAIGKTVKVSFDNGAVFDLHFKDNQTVQFEGHLTKDGETLSDTVSYEAVEIRPQVYMVYWTEPKAGSRVVHVQDFENNVVYTNIAQPDGSFLHFRGEMKIAE